MAHTHGPLHFPGNGPPFNHVCMMDGPDPEIRLSALQYENVVDENKRYQSEIQRLTALLREHNIQYRVAPPGTINHVSKNLTINSHGQEKSATADSYSADGEARPYLPMEILFRILGFALKSKHPVIDPFYKFRKENATSAEYSGRGDLNINCLAVCHAFRAEGMRLLIGSNDFVFTQAAALENFAKVPTQLRATIKHVTLRVVGRYYADRVRKVDLTGISNYHKNVRVFSVPIHARPRGMVNDNGIQAYCWYQVADFLKALQLPYATEPTFTATNNRPKLLPGLSTMRIDLVNFCDHLPLGITSFAPIIRWHLGPFLDELVLTGCPHDDISRDEKVILRNALRDEGLFSTACPAFISGKNFLKKLSVYEYRHQVVGARKAKNLSKKSNKHAVPQIHPEGGSPPVSSYPRGTTIWKWAKTEDQKPKEWIEFERGSGRPISEVELDDSDEDDDSYIAPLHGMLPNLLAHAIPAIIQGAMPPDMSMLADSDESDDEMPELLDLNHDTDEEMVGSGTVATPAAYMDTDDEMPSLLETDSAYEDTDDEMPSLLEIGNSTGIDDVE
ncbi:uncharacterized protein L3040_001985 [Drepanopeziza brunnea f. sp. 'multigermtubi']|nr:hypothetical protein L3040_001985 [Drepanopeziza brunnea f. sp. 'multigermtubi']